MPPASRQQVVWLCVLHLSPSPGGRESRFPLLWPLSFSDPGSLGFDGTDCTFGWELVIPLAVEAVEVPKEEEEDFPQSLFLLCQTLASVR